MNAYISKVIMTEGKKLSGGPKLCSCFKTVSKRRLGIIPLFCFAPGVSNRKPYLFPNETNKSTQLGFCRVMKSITWPKSQKNIIARFPDPSSIDLNLDNSAYLVLLDNVSRETVEFPSGNFWNSKCKIPSHVAFREKLKKEASLKFTRKYESRGKNKEAEIKRKWLISAFKQSPIGLFLSCITNSVNRNFVFAFNFENYDAPISLFYLVPAIIKVTGKRPKIQYRGNAIRHIRLNGGIILTDIKHHLSPGDSLQSFGESLSSFDDDDDLCKGVFPFSQLTNLEFLKRKKLPCDFRMWKNDLNPKNSPTQSEVDVILKEYDRLGFKSVGDYLEKYLKKDVYITQRGTLEYLEFQLATTETNFVLEDKTTCASTSNGAVHNYLAGKKRPCMFFVNQPKVYAMHKRGNRGGATAACTSVAGKNADYSSYQQLNRELFPGISNEENKYLTEHINSHVIRNGLASNYVCYMDLNSMYGGTSKEVVQMMMMMIFFVMAAFVGFSSSKTKPFGPLAWPPLPGANKAPVI